MRSVHQLLSKSFWAWRHKRLSLLSHLSNSLTTTGLCYDAHFQYQFPTSPEPYSGYSRDRAQIIVTLLSNCTSISQLDQIHAHLVRAITLEIYPSPFCWNNIIRSYIRLEAPLKALYAYLVMSRAGCLPDSYTLPITLKALSHVYGFDFGRQLHSVAIRIGLSSDMYCESGFISVYSKAGEIGNARKMFDENSGRELGSWNAIIGGLAQGGLAKEAVDVFVEMKQCGFDPDDVTMVSVTSACGSIGDLNLALQLHKYVLHTKATAKSEILMLNSLIDMYGKCGRMELAYRVFSEMDERNVSTWTSLIVGHAMHGHVNDAIGCFRHMTEAGVRPNHVTFVGILSACVHSGMVREGKYYFNLMKDVYRIKPLLSHYGCMVDLLGRAGLFEEARDMIEQMPMEANSVIWGSLMGACEKHMNVEMGEWVAQHLQELEPWNDGVYVVLSNLYASRGLWTKVEKAREVMKLRNLAKAPAYSLGTSSFSQICFLK